jgi:hypothetical protein
MTHSQTRFFGVVRLVSSAGGASIERADGGGRVFARPAEAAKPGDPFQQSPAILLPLTGHVSAQSTSGFDRLVPTGARFAIAQYAQRDDPGLAMTRNPGNVG